MRLRTKTLLVIGVTIVSLVGVLYAASSTILLSSLKRAEEQNTRQVVKGVLSSFDQAQDDFTARFFDWSAWDDTYAFVQNGSQDYIKSNLLPEQLTNLKLNLVLYLNPSAGIIFGTGFDWKKQTKTPIPEVIKQHLTPQDALLDHPNPQSRRMGILLLTEGPMLITSQPIVTSKGTGPIRGTLIFGRYLDTEAIRRLSNRTYLTLYRVNDPQMSPDLQVIRDSLSEEKPIVVRVIDEQTVAGYTLLKDIYGKPVLLMQVDVYRGIYQQSQSSLRYLTVSILLAGLIFGGVTLLLLERLVLSRLEKLSTGVKKIAASSNLSLRVLSQGKDELSKLGDGINQMLEALQESQYQRQENEQRHRAVVEQASEGILLFDADTKQILEANSAIQQLLGYSSEAILQLKIYDIAGSDRQNIDDNIQEIRTEKHRSLGERPYKRQDGSLVDVEVSASFISYGGGDAICAVVRDITERKQSEEALRKAEEKYRQIFQHASEGIFQVTPEGRFISANPAIASILGYSSIDELTRSITNIGKQLYVDQNRRAKLIATVQKKDAVTRFVSQVYRQNGSVIWISENTRAVRDEDGKLLYYEGTLEDITYRKVAEEALRYQQEQAERLLLNILPEPIAVRLKLEESNIADSFAEVTVLFADIVGFTELSADIPPTELVKLLNDIFSAFDQLAENHKLEKIKTIGDAYMVVGGIPLHKPDHAEAIAAMALDMLQEISRFQTQKGKKFSIRIGINTGPVVAGVIGIKKFIYDLWGDTVNIASRMESQGLPGCIQVTASTYTLLAGKFVFEERGTIQVKGKGEMTTYLLLGRSPR